jgi:hypothetical protein
MQVGFVGKPADGMVSNRQEVGFAYPFAVDCVPMAGLHVATCGAPVAQARTIFGGGSRFDGI